MGGMHLLMRTKLAGVTPQDHLFAHIRSLGPKIPSAAPTSRNQYSTLEHNSPWQRNGAEPQPQMPDRAGQRASHGCSLRHTGPVLRKGLCLGVQRPEHRPSRHHHLGVFWQACPHSPALRSRHVSPSSYWFPIFQHPRMLKSPKEPSCAGTTGCLYHTICPSLLAGSKSHFCLTCRLQLPVSVLVLDIPSSSLPALAQPLSCTRAAGWGGHNWIVELT